MVSLASRTVFQEIARRNEHTLFFFLSGQSALSTAAEKCATHGALSVWVGGAEEYPAVRYAIVEEDLNHHLSSIIAPDLSLSTGATTCFGYTTSAPGISLACSVSHRAGIQPGSATSPSNAARLRMLAQLGYREREDEHRLEGRSSNQAQAGSLTRTMRRRLVVPGRPNGTPAVTTRRSPRSASSSRNAISAAVSTMSAPL